MVNRKEKRTNNNLQNTTQKSKDWAMRTPQKNQRWTRVLWMVVPAPLVAPIKSDCYLKPNEQLLSYIMMRSYIWWDDDVHIVLDKHA
jgi:hypothetical protein